jgi:hypothetical protein
MRVGQVSVSHFAKNRSTSIEETLKQGIGFFALFIRRRHTPVHSLKVGVDIGLGQGF